MYLHWNSALLKSVQLFLLSSKQCIIMTDMFSLHKLYITHSSSSCLMATGDFHSSYDSLCSANWVENRRLLGNNGAAARDAPLKLFSRALLESMLSNHKILPLVIIFKPSSHAGIQAENAVFFEKKSFPLGLLLLNINFTTHYPRTIIKIILQDLNAARFINLSNFL